MWGKKHAAGVPLEWVEALNLVLSCIEKKRPRKMPLLAAQGLVCGEKAYSSIDVPPFDNSAMDGFAVKVGDIAYATTQQPALLRVIGTAAAGAPYTGSVGKGEAVEIMTGAPVPAGADAVVRVEWTRPAEQPGLVAVLQNVPLHSSFRRAGADTADRQHSFSSTQGNISLRQRVLLLPKRR